MKRKIDCWDIIYITLCVCNSVIVFYNFSSFNTTGKIVALGVQISFFMLAAVALTRDIKQYDNFISPSSSKVAVPSISPYRDPAASAIPKLAPKRPHLLQEVMDRLEKAKWEEGIKNVSSGKPMFSVGGEFVLSEDYLSFRGDILDVPANWRCSTFTRVFADWQAEQKRTKQEKKEQTQKEAILAARKLKNEGQ